MAAFIPANDAFWSRMYVRTLTRNGAKGLLQMYNNGHSLATSSSKAARCAATPGAATETSEAVLCHNWLQPCGAIYRSIMWTVSWSAITTEALCHGWVQSWGEICRSIMRTLPRSLCNDRMHSHRANSWAVHPVFRRSTTSMYHGRVPTSGALSWRSVPQLRGPSPPTVCHTGLHPLCTTHKCTLSAMYVWATTKVLVAWMHPQDGPWCSRQVPTVCRQNAEDVHDTGMYPHADEERQVSAVRWHPASNGLVHRMYSPIREPPRRRVFEMQGAGVRVLGARVPPHSNVSQKVSHARRPMPPRRLRTRHRARTWWDA